MSSPEHWPYSSPYQGQQTPRSDQREYDNAPQSRTSSLDLATSYGIYGVWNEMQPLPSPGRSDTEKLLQAQAWPTRRRSSSTSSTLSNDTAGRINRATKLLNRLDGKIEHTAQLPVVSHIVKPFKWIGRFKTGFMSKSRFQGWRMGILLGCFMSMTILACNITILVFGAVKNGGFQDGFSTPFTGQAEDMSFRSSAFHILINILSTLLLAASNYTMQVLSSPTRQEIDRAHTSNQWLDIGILSLHNFGRISRRRRLLSVIMAISSIPVHLFYNSAIFYIGANNDYSVHLVRSGSVGDTVTVFPDTSFTKMNTAELSKAYLTDFVGYKDLYIVVDDYASEINSTTITGFPNGWPNTDERKAWNPNTTWPIGPMPKFTSLRIPGANTKDWILLSDSFEESNSHLSLQAPKFAHITHGYATKTDTLSRIQLSFAFMIIVISCNVLKLCTMLWVVFMEREDYLVTMGDGAASFLGYPDPKTERMCVSTRHDIIDNICDPDMDVKPHNDELAAVVSKVKGTWSKEYSTYSTALDRDREYGSYFIFIVIGLLFAGSLATLCTLGKFSTKWGTASDNVFLKGFSSAQSTLTNAWVANAFQLILSFCYLAINSECTAMAGAAEWNHLATSRKGLRVTRPVGQQRDTYFLQLPYRWSLPLTAASFGLHWLLSQSIFIVRIDQYDKKGKLDVGESQSACGFSGLSFLMLAVSFYVLVSVVGLVGRRKMRIRIPFAASCSLVISAACHPPRDDADAQLRPVQWGVAEGTMFDGEKHCTLTSKTVTRPKIGGKYL